MTDLLAVARRLYQRRQSGLIVPYRMVDERHVEAECHQNAGTWVRDNTGFKVVHGWLVFDYERTTRGLFSLVQFNPHSIVEADDGERFDPTPSRASQRYSFLDHEGSREEFIELVEGHALSVLSYDPFGDQVV
jgi:hypothetical protein